MTLLLFVVSSFLICHYSWRNCVCQGYSPPKQQLVQKVSNEYHSQQQKPTTKFFFPRVMVDITEQKNGMTNEHNPLEINSRKRRQLFNNWLSSSFFFLTTTATTSGSSIANAVMYENAPMGVSDVIRLSSGTTIQDLRLGDGPIIEEGQRVNIQWSLKRSNGYIIDSSSNHDGVPFIFIVGNHEKNSPYRAIQGLDDGIRGMKVGGIRRIIMPPSQTYVEGLNNENCPGPIPPDFGPKQRIDRVMKLRADVPDESFLLDIKPTRIQ